MLNEFTLKSISAHIHNLLRSRWCRNSESVLQYFLVKREIANRISLDESSLIHYVIAGAGSNDTSEWISSVDDSNLAQFKAKLRIYEEIHEGTLKFARKPKYTGTQSPKASKSL